MEIEHKGKTYESVSGVHGKYCQATDKSHACAWQCATTNKCLDSNKFTDIVPGCKIKGKPIVWREKKQDGS